MSNNSKITMNEIDRQLFADHLADYVRLQFEGRAADEAYPEIAFYIATFKECEAAYYREFRAQGKRKSTAELREVGQREQTAAVIQHIAGNAAQVAPDPNWYEVVQGRLRAW